MNPLEDDDYAADMDSMHTAARCQEARFRLISACHEGNTGQHAERIEWQEEGDTGDCPPLQEQDYLTLCYELRA